MTMLQSNFDLWLQKLNYLKFEDKINEVTVLFFLNEEGKASGEYNVQEKQSYVLSQSPHFKFKIVSAEKFDEKLRLLEAEMPDGKTISYN